MFNFCTLFDSNYMSRGLSMYYSLAKTHTTFHLYVFAFDDMSLKILRALNLPNMTVISLLEFEDQELLKIKPTRTQTEYCWTCTPSVILYCLNKFNLDLCTYLDADIFFFNSTEEIFSEFGTNDVLITEHRFSEQYAHYSVNGIYNVQFMTFRKTENGMKALNWWRNACNEWCYARLEDGKLGDQKYLDDWTSRFQGIHVLQHWGGGMGPWNIQQIEINPQGQKFEIKRKKDSKVFTPIFFHFHNFKFYNEGYGRAINYLLSEDIIQFIYRPYLKEVLRNYEQTATQFAEFKGKGFDQPFPDKMHILQSWQRKSFNGDNIIVYSPEKFKSFRKSIRSNVAINILAKLKTKLSMTRRIISEKFK